MRSQSLKLKLSELVKRLNGFSTPVFGVQWSPSTDERNVVRGFLAFLEDRRALYEPLETEIREQVNYSILEIRKKCTDALALLGEHSPASQPIRGIRTTCRRFLNLSANHFPGLPGGKYAYLRHDGQDAGFFVALGECRALIGFQIAILAVKYEIELEADLASILPPIDTGTED